MMHKYLFQPSRAFYLVLLIIFISFFKDQINAQVAWIDENLIELLMGVVTIVAAFRMKGKTGNLGERLFWFNIRLAMVVWFITKLGILISAYLRSQEAILKIAAYGYFGFFMAMVFAVILKNYQTRHRSVLALQQYGAIFFVLGLFAYLVLIPSQLSQNEFRQLYSSYLFYIVLDVYLMLLFWTKALQSRRADNFRTYLWFGAGSFVFLMLDSVELIQTAGLIERFTHPLQHTIWYVPYLCFTMALNPKIDAIPKEGRTLPSWFPSPLLVSATVLPIIHATGHSMEWFFDEAEVNREWLLAIWVLSFIVLISKQENFIVNRYRRLRTKYESLPRTNPTENEQTHSPFPLVQLDVSGRITFANKALLDLLGYQASQLKGQFFSGLFPKDEPFARFFKGMETSLNSNSLVSLEQREVNLEDAAGHSIPCYMRTMESNNALAISFVDISTLKLAEEQALSVKDKFIANITHEFRTPLTIIQGALEEGIDSNLDESLKKRMYSALRNNARILKMVEQLLMLSKLTSAPKLNASTQPLSDVVRNAVELFAPLCEQKQMKFEYELVDSLWADIHEDSLQQILYNLLTNAYKYTPEEGTITLHMDVNGKMLSIIVTDTGKGFDSNESSQIFGRFQRAKGVNVKTFGVGIGLSVVNELIEAHSWKLSVKSEPDKGTRFIIDIPLVDAPKYFAGEIKPVDFSLEDSGFVYQGENETGGVSKERDRLLIIEDNADMQEYLAHLTEQNFETDICGLGEKGLKAAIDQVPDIIICDLMLPDISGFQVVEQLKANDVTAHIPILMLTAKADMDSKLEGLQKKVDDYLTKPFHYQELLLRLRNLLAGREAAQTQLKSRLLSEQAFGNADEDGIEVVTEDSAVSAFLKKLNSVVEKHYQDESFNMGELAGQLGLSERQLQRKMRGVLSLTPGEYLREFRLMKAKRLLTTGIQVGLVADQVGFSSQAYFTKCFKEWQGETPSSYQKQAQV
ncbi:helix-turn-helix domain-containing protein [Paraneptunicella aestuarii]|uniref:hybrid sensor histidine kinase/response regulator transcription factor n=1 Tax=Paraneptunicella aestuarii TaxID=2831148 RepID=UPI001E5AA349|nr:ATP-binding protein [Paraneptunicella aestuarii]UAA38374.1 helix-turn-helix domain-containing protein [Paraneptunicella aestuarii]